jgi:hypothetical protein
MFPMHTQDNLRDREREVRRSAERRRRLEAERERDRPLDLDAEIRALMAHSERVEPHHACAECAAGAADELTARRGRSVRPAAGRAC